MNNKTKKKRFLPLWVSGLILLELIAIIGVTIVGMQDITTMHPDQSGQSYLSSLYIFRNFVACAALAAATFYFRSYIAFFIAFSSRIATEVADFTNSYLYERDVEVLSTIPYLAFFMVILPTIAIVFVWPDVKREMEKLKLEYTN